VEEDLVLLFVGLAMRTGNTGRSQVTQGSDTQGSDMNVSTH
jgi:hypothetical protein